MEDTYLTRTGCLGETILKYSNLTTIMGREKVNQIADSLRNMSEEFGVYELGVFHIRPQTDENQPFLLVGLDKSNEKASEIHSKWKSKWSSRIYKKEEESIGDREDTTVMEYAIR